MGFRVGDEDVKGIITAAGTDELGNSINLSFFIRTANLLVDKIDAADADGELTASDLKEIEAYLAAHFYTHRDQQYAQSKSDDASDIYQGKTGMYLDSSLYGQTAILLDTTGYLAKLNNPEKRAKHTLNITWLGKKKSEQIDYVDRD